MSWNVPADLRFLCDQTCSVQRHDKRYSCIFIRAYIDIIWEAQKSANSNDSQNLQNAIYIFECSPIQSQHNKKQDRTGIEPVISGLCKQRSGAAAGVQYPLACNVGPYIGQETIDSAQ